MAEAELPSLPPGDNSPFWETNLFWGCFGAFFGGVCTVIGMYTRAGLAHLLLFVAWPFAVLALWCALVKLSAKIRTWATAALSILIGVALFALDRGIVVVPPTETPVVSLACEWIPLPFPVKANSKIYLLEPMMPGLAQITTPRDSTIWPDGTTGREMYRCSLVNHGNDPVFNVEAPFTTTMLEMITEDGGKQWHSGKRLPSQAHLVQTPELDRSAGTLVFYLWNGSSEQFAEFVSTDYVTLETFKSARKTKVPLKLPGSQPIKVPLGPMELPKHSSSKVVP